MHVPALLGIGLMKYARMVNKHCLHAPLNKQQNQTGGDGLQFARVDRMV